MAEQENKVGQMTFDFGAAFEEKVPSVPENSVEEEWDAVEEGEFDFSGDPELDAEMAEELREEFEAVSQPETETEIQPETETVSASSSDRTVPDQGKVVSEEEAVLSETEVLPAPAVERELKKADLKRAALAFLASQGACAVARDVPTRGNRFRADAAAFFPGDPKQNQSLRTALAEVRTASEARIECATHAQQRTMLRAARLERETLEQEIRRTEPHLRDDSNLFVEFEQWNYSSSVNPAYKECLQKIRDLEYTLFHGSRLSKFHTAGIATELYLVVPEGAVCMESVAENWGLVFVKKDLTFELVKKPQQYDCPAGNLSRMVRNIASSACKEVLFANGIREDKSPDGVRCFKVGALPRKRRM